VDSSSRHIFYIDQDGKRIPIPIEVVAETFAECIKILYFDAMLSCYDATHENARKGLMSVAFGVIDDAINKYTDHLDALREQKYGKGHSGNTNSPESSP